MKRTVWLVLLLAMAALTFAACGRDDDDDGDGGGGGGGDPGITDDSIKLGGSYPFSGPASAYRSIEQGAQAYFSFVNAKGGVDGRKIEHDVCKQHATHRCHHLHRDVGKGFRSAQLAAQSHRHGDGRIEVRSGDRTEQDDEDIQHARRRDAARRERQGRSRAE